MPVDIHFDARRSRFLLAADVDTTPMSFKNVARLPIILPDAVYVSFVRCRHDFH